jgi:hypothetical protein
MELVESLEKINYFLEKEYGRTDDKPNWRVIFSEDQHERQLTEEGIKEVKKYPWIHEKYLLERLLPTGEMGLKYLLSALSYEPIFVFMNGKEEYLPPRIEVCKLVIESVMRESAKRVNVKYKDPEAGQDPLEVQADRVDRLQKELFGNETSTGDSLHYKEGISVPSNYSVSSNHKEQN